MRMQVLKDGLTVAGKVWTVDEVIDTGDKTLAAIPEHVTEAVKAGEHPHLRKVTKKQAEVLEEERAVEPEVDLPPAGVRPVDAGEVDDTVMRTERESAKGTITAQLVSRQKRTVKHESPRSERV